MFSLHRVPPSYNTFSFSSQWGSHRARSHSVSAVCTFESYSALQTEYCLTISLIAFGSVNKHWISPNIGPKIVITYFVRTDCYQSPITILVPNTSVCNFIRWTFLNLPYMRASLVKEYLLDTRTFLLLVSLKDKENFNQIDPAQSVVITPFEYVYSIYISIVYSNVIAIVISIYNGVDICEKYSGK